MRIASGLDFAAKAARELACVAQRQSLGAAERQLLAFAIDPVNQPTTGITRRGVDQREPRNTAQIAMFDAGRRRRGELFDLLHGQRFQS